MIKAHNTYTSVSKVGDQTYLYIYDCVTGNLLIQAGMKNEQIKDLIVGLTREL